MVETLVFMLHNLPIIGERALEHISIVSVAVGIAILTGVPLGIAITQSQRAADTVLYLGSIVMTIPSIALFGVLIPLLSKIGQGIGYLPAVIAVLLYSQLPIMAGVRIAVVINIGITAISTYIGAGGLGAFISRGISQTDPRQLITGALAVSLLAIFADYFQLWVQHRLTPKGLRLSPAQIPRAT